MLSWTLWIYAWEWVVTFPFAGYFTSNYMRKIQPPPPLKYSLANSTLLVAAGMSLLWPALWWLYILDFKDWIRSKHD